MSQLHPFHIGVITVRGMDYHPTRRLADAAASRGGRVSAIHPYGIRPAFVDGHPELIGDDTVADVDAILPRQGAEIRDACLPLLNHVAQMGIPVINSLPGILSARNQFWTLQALAASGVPVPDSTFIPAATDPQALWDHIIADTVVAKAVSGRQGQGVQRLRRGGDPLAPALALALADGRGLVVQRYIEPAGRTDIRAMVIGDAVAGAVRLSPREGDFRANFHLTGSAEAMDLPEDIQKMAVRATRAVGLEIAGVDMMIGADDRLWVGEVNYAPGFRGLETATGRDIAGAMIDYAVDRITGRTGIPSMTDMEHR